MLNYAFVIALLGSAQQAGGSGPKDWETKVVSLCLKAIVYFFDMQYYMSNAIFADNIWVLIGEDFIFTYTNVRGPEFYCNICTSPNFLN